MVGGSASALYARHRFSTDHDHVSATLEQNYNMVLEALDATDGWVANFRSAPPKTILGMESGFEAGLRQLRRQHPLEVTTVRLPSGAELVIPTHDEILRIKAYLIVNRNQVRDYLDTAALAESLGIDHARAVLQRIDNFYTELSNTDGAVSTVLAERLYHAKPRDHKAIASLASYKGLDPRWSSWKAVESVCRELAEGML